MDDSEVLARALCRKHNLDPDGLVNIDDDGTMRPLWTAWQSSAVGDLEREARVAYRAAEEERQKAFRDGWLAHAAHVARQALEEY